MQLYDLTSPLETMLANKSDKMRHPLGGSMELLPLCNMDCKMCFIRQNPTEMKKQGRMLTCDEWLRIAGEAKKAGVLFLLLTGGEPLIFPEFKRLYTALGDMGFIMTVNTNGTLIDEDWADFFAQRPCRRLNITLYGDSDEAYARLCKTPDGHTRVMRALDLLGERNIAYRLNFTVTPENVKQLPYACKIAKERNVAIDVVPYLFPPIRRENNMFSRITPQEAVQVRLDKILHLYGEEQLEETARAILNEMKYTTFQGTDALACRAGRSGFWMSWTGDLLPCGMFLEPKASLLNHSFSDAWRIIVEETEKLRIYPGCRNCEKRTICNVCAASCLAESGDMTKKPEYMCEMTEAYYRLLKQYGSKKWE